MAVSWPVVLFAFAALHELGVDVERIRPIREAGDIARAHFTSQERQALEAAFPTDQPRTFFRIWARKEALVKALGIGLTADLSSVDVLNRPEPVPHATPAAVELSENWALADFDVGAGFAAALCLPAGWAIESPGRGTRPAS
jgi:4'-phosphopantetheinyl transferase